MRRNPVDDAFAVADALGRGVSSSFLWAALVFGLFGCSVTLLIVGGETHNGILVFLGASLFILIMPVTAAAVLDDDVGLGPVGLIRHVANVLSLVLKIWRLRRATRSADVLAHLSEKIRDDTESWRRRPIHIAPKGEM